MKQVLKMMGVMMGLVMWGGSAQASVAGDLDFTFSDNITRSNGVLTGRVVSTLNTNNPGIPSLGAYSDVVTQTDGKIIAVGIQKTGDAGFDVLVERFLGNGLRDTSFGGGDGRVFTNFSLADRANAVLFQPDDGKILVAGRTAATSSSGAAPFDFFLARYLSDGTLDPTFGTNGIVRTDFFGRSDEASAIVRRSSDLKIIVVGKSGTDIAIAQYNPNGTLDTSFSGDGLVLKNFFSGGDSIEAAEDVVLDNIGRILVAGTFKNVGTGATNDFFVARFRTNGNLDITDGQNIGFGEQLASGARQGRLFFGFGSGFQDRARTLAINSSGIYVAGSTQSTDSLPADFAIARLTGNGDIDPNFGGGDGRVTTNFASGSSDVARDIIFERQGGKFIVVGEAKVNTNTGQVFTFAVSRYNASGTLDTSYGQSGLRRTVIDSANFTHSFPQAVAIHRLTNDDENFDRIVVAGSVSKSASDPNFDQSSPALARYVPSPCGDDVKQVLGEECDGTAVGICSNETPCNNGVVAFIGGVNVRVSPPTCLCQQCGNGSVGPDEECDDGNIDNGDGCDALCKLENPENCGNGAEDPGETCDDGNTELGDGCSATCQVELAVDVEGEPDLVAASGGCSLIIQ